VKKAVNEGEEVVVRVGELLEEGRSLNSWGGSALSWRAARLLCLWVLKFSMASYLNWTSHGGLPMGRSHFFCAQSDAQRSDFRKCQVFLAAAELGGTSPWSPSTVSAVQAASSSNVRFNPRQCGRPLQHTALLKH